MSAPKPQKASSIEDLLKQASAVANARAPQKKASDQVGDSGAGTSTATATDPAKSVKKTIAKTVTEKLQEKMEGIKLRDLEMRTQEEAVKQGMQYIALRGFPIAPEALSLIPKETAKQLHAVAFLNASNNIRLGTTNPTEEVKALVKKIADTQHAKAELYFISQDSFNFAFDLYNILPEVKEVIYGYRIEESDLAKYEKEISNFTDLQKKITEVSTSDIVAMMFGAALKSGASDVHVEAEEEDVKIRFRMDGILNEAAKLQKSAWKQMIGRLKLLAGVKINVEDVPQDGRITIYLAKEKIDIRVSFLPTAFGESVVMRILRPKAVALEFDNLGVRGAAWERLQKQVERPNGMIVTTGPTGSGKTTTLYAILKKLNSPEVKIITLEDPIEYKLQGINQSQIDHSKHYDFAGGLRSILRQDPDVVMVGEIRDLETAEISIQAALTGHLVVSTIHTNSAAGAIPRFMSMGVKPFLLAPALNAVIGQRLVRRLCKDCKVLLELEPAVLAQCKKILEGLPPNSEYKVDINNLKFSGPGNKKDCATCEGRGYKGRIGIYEIFVMTKEIEAVILSSEVSEYQIQDLAVKDGMVTMAQDGLLKALDGLTSVQEVLAVVNVDSTILEPVEGAPPAEEKPQEKAI